MTVTVDVSSNKVIPRMMAALGAEGRSDLYAVAVEAKGAGPLADEGPVRTLGGGLW